MININPKNKQKSVNKLLEEQLANIQTQFDEVNDAIETLSNATSANFTTVNANISACQSLIAGMTTTQQTTASQISALQASVAALQTALAQALTTVSLNFTTATGTTVNAETVKADSADVTSLEADNATVESLTATSATLSSATIQALNVVSLTLTQLTADTATLQNIISAAGKIDDLTVQGIQSSQAYSSTGYQSDDDIDKFRIVLNPGFIAYSTDPDDPWSLTWNGGLEYNNPQLSIKRIDIQHEEDALVAYVYIYHPGEEINFNVINFGNYDVEITVEEVVIASAYEEENCVYYGVIGASGSSSSGGLSPMFVNTLPETGLSTYIYIVANDRSYVWDSANNKFVEMSGDLNAERAARIAADEAHDELIAANASAIEANTASIQSHATKLSTIEGNISTLTTASATHDTEIAAINAVIPDTATSSNKLAVQSSVTTNASNIGTNTAAIAEINKKIPSTATESNQMATASDVTAERTYADSTFQKKLTAGANISIENNVISCNQDTMNFKGSVATSTDLPESADNGDVYNVVDTATNYCWNGSAWIAIGSSVDVSGLMNKDGSNADIPDAAEEASSDTKFVCLDDDGKLQAATVPASTVDSALSTTSENPVSNKVITNDMGVFIDDDASIPNSISVNLSEAPFKGMHLKVLLQKKLYSTVSSGRSYVIVSVKGTTTSSQIVVYSASKALTSLPSHLIDGVYVFAQIGTTLELVYDGTYWVVMGNPEVITYTSDDVSYRIKADGLITMWMTIYNSGSATKEYPTPFTTTNYDFVSCPNIKMTKVTDSFVVSDYNSGVSSKPSSTQPLDCLIQGY